MTKTINEKLADIQTRLHAPKDKDNSFGGYKYRNAEGIIAAFKALGIEGATLRCTDTLQEVGGQIFVSAEAILCIDGKEISATGHAMHPLQKKGMDASQITGSASSYARKYALSGLFAIDDSSQDPDSRDNRKEQGQTKPEFNAAAEFKRLKAALVKQTHPDALDKLYAQASFVAAFNKLPEDMQGDLQSVFTERMAEITIDDHIPHQ